VGVRPRMTWVALVGTLAAPVARADANRTSSLSWVAPVPANPPAEDELALLQGAADRVRANPSEALALADEHAARFPSGGLAQEREVIAIEALVTSRTLVLTPTGNRGFGLGATTTFTRSP
jgi:hypothetical protein